MSDLAKVDQFLGKIAHVKDADALFRVVEREIADLGFERYNYALSTRADGSRVGSFFTNYPAEWVERYVGESYQADDVIVHKLAETVRPFSWQDTTTARHLTPTQKNILNEATEFNLNSGAAIPVYRW